MSEKITVEVGGRVAIGVFGLGSYSLTDTLECGQCFRYERKETRPPLIVEYIVTARGAVIDVGQRERGELLFFGMSDEEFERIVPTHFALDNDLDRIKRDIVSHTDSEWLQSAAEFSSGIAILKQDPWETLVSFIISQNNNIPRIRKIIKQICSEYGVNICLQNGDDPKCPLELYDGTPCEENCKRCGVCYSFPTPEDILNRPEGLLPSHPGFRYSYILDAAQKVHSRAVDLDMIAAARNYTHTIERLKEIKGVGDKVASCCALFGFANLEAFPIDVWMRRAIDTYFGGELDPATLGRYAGVAQQYIFHYIRNNGE